MLSDRTLRVIHRYGMKDPERAFVLTGHVVIDRAGRIRARKVDPLFGEHAEEIVKVLQEAPASNAVQARQHNAAK